MRNGGSDPQWVAGEMREPGAVFEIPVEDYEALLPLSIVAEE